MGCILPYCSESQGTLFAAAHLVITDFSDAGGWNAERYYKSIWLKDVNNDGTADVCGRGFAGIICAGAWPVVGGYINFGTPILVVPNFGDVDGFGASESYWGTVQPYGNYVQRVTLTTGGQRDVNTFAWIGRGYAGIYISIYDEPECVGWISI